MQKFRRGFAPRAVRAVLVALFAVVLVAPSASAQRSDGPTVGAFEGGEFPYSHAMCSGLSSITNPGPGAQCSASAEGGSLATSLVYDGVAFGHAGWEMRAQTSAPVEVRRATPSLTATVVIDLSATEKSLLTAADRQRSVTMWFGSSVCDCGAQDAVQGSPDESGRVTFTATLTDPTGGMLPAGTYGLGLAIDDRGESNSTVGGYSISTNADVVSATVVAS